MIFWCVHLFDGEQLGYCEDLVLHTVYDRCYHKPFSFYQHLPCMQKWLSYDAASPQAISSITLLSHHCRQIHLPMYC